MSDYYYCPNCSTQHSTDAIDEFNEEGVEVCFCPKCGHGPCEYTPDDDDNSLLDIEPDDEITDIEDEEHDIINDFNDIAERNEDS